MSVWSLISTMCSDPGYIPVSYEYDANNMTRTTQALYNFVQLHKDAKLE
jgi:hypothetical protein